MMKKIFIALFFDHPSKFSFDAGLKAREYKIMYAKSEALFARLRYNGIAEIKGSIGTLRLATSDFFIADSVI